MFRIKYIFNLVIFENTLTRCTKTSWHWSIICMAIRMIGILYLINLREIILFWAVMATSSTTKPYIVCCFYIWNITWLNILDLKHSSCKLHFAFLLSLCFRSVKSNFEFTMLYCYVLQWYRINNNIILHFIVIFNICVRTN